MLSNVYADFRLCRVSHITPLMLSAIMLNVIMLSVVAPITGLGPNSQHFIFFVIYECAKQAGVLDYTWLERLASGKALNYWSN